MIILLPLWCLLWVVKFNQPLVSFFFSCVYEREAEIEMGERERGGGETLDRTQSLTHTNHRLYHCVISSGSVLIFLTVSQCPTQWATPYFVLFLVFNRL